MKTLALGESIKLAQKYGIRFVKTAHARTESEAEKACRHIGFPVVMKVISSQITHKTDSGGVKVGIRTIEEARETFVKLRKLKGFEGVAVQQMAQGTEIIIGGIRDVQFGPAVLFGFGGIYAEVFKDYCLRLCPIERKTALEMVKSVKAYPILAGARGTEGANIGKIVKAIMDVSKLMMKEGNVLELDINPLMASKKELIAVDARVVTN
ncbi:MAG TPA: acetate--CoA ligase family protein [archaeon]|nr:acetate--CoA ligase family protein [archaeon]